MNAPTAYRPCVGICLFNRKGLVFVGERIDAPGAWQMPQGGLEKNENIESAARPELVEETGIEQAELLEILPRKLRYDIPADILSHLSWGKNYRGQEQSWIALLFRGKDSDIDIRAHKHPEFRRWKWMPLEDVPGHIVPWKHEVYRYVVAAFSKHAKET